MGRTIPIQTSFAGGEISPRLRGRVDTDLWKKGLAECINFEPLAHGPLLSRGGTRHGEIIAGLNDNSRLVEFPRLGDIGFSMAIGGGVLSVRDGTTGAQVPSGGIDHLRNSRFTYGWQYWEKSSLVSVVGNGRYILAAAVPGGGARGQIWQSTASLPAGNYLFIIHGATAAGNWMNIKIGTVGAGSADILDSTFSTNSLSDVSGWRWPINVPAPGVVTVLVESGSESAEVIGENDRCGVQVIQASLQSEGTGAALWDDTTTPAMPWTDPQLEALQIIAEPANNRVLFFHGEVPPHELAYDADSDSWAFAPITFTFTDPLSPDWAGPTYPSCAELFQGRLIVAGIKGQMNTVIASQSGSLFNFTRGTNASDGFMLDISTKGAIRWLQGHRTMLMGTDRGELALVAQGGVLTPSDFEVRPQSGYGSAEVQPVQVGDAALYVSRDRRRIRMLTFNLQENGWQSRDLTFTGEHLTGGLIKDIDWLSTGNDQILAVLRSGEIVGWTFNRQEQVIAPWRIAFRDDATDDFGKVHAVCVLEAGDQDKVWVLVQRVGGVAIEEWLVADDPERCLLDGYVTKTPAAGVVSGLTHLAGKSVLPIVDGVAGEAQTVTVGGTITVSAAAASVVVGTYPLRSFTTLPREGGQPGGTAAGSKQRVVKLSLRFNDSALPLVNGDRISSDRTPETSMGEVESRVTGDATCRVLGWDEKGVITVEQDRPIRTEVLAVYGVLSTSEV